MLPSVRRNVNDMNVLIEAGGFYSRKYGTYRCGLLLQTKKVACSFALSVAVTLSRTIASRAKMVEPIEMPFGMWVQENMY